MRRRVVCWIVPLLAGSLALAAGSPAPADERFLDAPIFDDGARITHRPLTWGDFKGLLPRHRARSDAQLKKGLALGDFRVVTWQEDEEWVAAPLDVRPYAVVELYESFADPAVRNAKTLAHHQLHFDLFEAWGRALAVELRSLRRRGAYAYDAERALRVAVRRAFEESRGELFALDDEFDRNTRQGFQPREERRWAKRIARLMDDATAALVRAIEQPPPGSTGSIEE